MERIEAESARMGGLVDDLLTLARLDEVREPERERFRLDEVLAEACEDARAAAPGRPIALDGTRPVEVVGNAEQIRRVLDNLLRNAVVHTPEGTPIEASLAAEGEEAVLRVRDHGPGIAAEDPQAVFERFWRSSSSRGRDDGGAGLGLAIVAAIAEAHGGSVEAANAVRRRRRVHPAAAAFGRCSGAVGEIDLSVSYTARNSKPVSRIRGPKTSERGNRFWGESTRSGWERRLLQRQPVS